MLTLKSEQSGTLLTLLVAQLLLLSHYLQVGAKVFICVKWQQSDGIQQYKKNKWITFMTTFFTQENTQLTGSKQKEKKTTPKILIKKKNNIDIEIKR